MTKYIICDLDGTLCNWDHRYHLFADKATRSEFYRLQFKDTPYENIRLLLWALHSGAYKIVYCTNRLTKYKAITSDWLKKYECPPGILLMRKPGDNRGHAEIKLDLIKEAGIDHKDILLILDDFKPLVEELRELGLTVLQPKDTLFKNWVKVED